MEEAINTIIKEYERRYPDLNYVEYQALYELYLAAKRCEDLYDFKML